VTGLRGNPREEPPPSVRPRIAVSNGRRAFGRESSCASTRRLIVSRRCYFQREDPLCRPARGWAPPGWLTSVGRSATGSTQPIGRSPRPSGEHPAPLLPRNVCALFAAKDHVTVFLYDGAIVLIPRGPSAPTTRRPAPSRPQGERINAPALSACSGRLATTGRAAGASALLPLAQARWRGRPLAIRSCRTIEHRSASGTTVSDRDPSIRD
jgi:hypothetical protein